MSFVIDKSEDKTLKEALDSNESCLCLHWYKNRGASLQHLFLFNEKMPESSSFPFEDNPGSLSSTGRCGDTKTAQLSDFSDRHCKNTRLFVTQEWMDFPSWTPNQRKYKRKKGRKRALCKHNERTLGYDNYPSTRWNGMKKPTNN